MYTYIPKTSNDKERLILLHNWACTDFSEIHQVLKILESWVEVLFLYSKETLNVYFQKRNSYPVFSVVLVFPFSTESRNQTNKIYRNQHPGLSGKGVEHKRHLSKQVIIVGQAEGPHLLPHTAQLLLMRHTGQHWLTSKISPIERLSIDTAATWAMSPWPQALWGPSWCLL